MVSQSAVHSQRNKAGIRREFSGWEHRTVPVLQNRKITAAVRDIQYTNTVKAFSDVAQLRQTMQTQANGSTRPLTPLLNVCWCLCLLSLESFI